MPSKTKVVDEDPADLPLDGFPVWHNVNGTLRIGVETVGNGVDNPLYYGLNSGDGLQRPCRFPRVCPIIDLVEWTRIFPACSPKAC